jgi:membrane-bound ClpP family serine protease
MWILSITPVWVFHAITLAGIIGIISGFLLAFIPFIRQYKLSIQVISIVLLVSGIFMEGAMLNEQVWLLKVAEMEQKMAEAEAKSAQENVKLVEKIVVKKEYIKSRGRDIVKYIDKEIVKYDSKFAAGGQCEIPKEFYKAINDAAQEPNK